MDPLVLFALPDCALLIACRWPYVVAPGATRTDSRQPRACGDSESPSTRAAQDAAPPTSSPLRPSTRRHVNGEVFSVVRSSDRYSSPTDPSS